MSTTTNGSTNRPQGRPKTKGNGVAYALLVGSVVATLGGAHLLARQDQSTGSMSAQAAQTLLVPARGELGGVALDLQPIPTVMPHQFLPVRPVARTRSSR